MTISSNAAQRALDIINNLGGVAEDFRRSWLTLHAYSTEFDHGGDQRAILINAIESTIDDTTAETIIDSFSSDINYLNNNPVGDLRFTEQNSRFRRNSLRDIQNVLDLNIPAATRLGNLLCVIYQVRCNLEHGRKQLGIERSQRLFDIGNRIISSVIQTLVPLSNAR